MTAASKTERGRQRVHSVSEKRRGFRRAPSRHTGNDWRYRRRGVIVTTAAPKKTRYGKVVQRPMRNGWTRSNDAAARSPRRVSVNPPKGHRGNEPQCETLPEDSFRLILARPPPAAGWLLPARTLRYISAGSARTRGPQARMCSLTTSKGERATDRASHGQQRRPAFVAIIGDKLSVGGFLPAGD